MNTRNTLLAILTASLALPVLADTSSAVVTRDQVKAEYVRALKAGELDYGREFITPLADVRKSPGSTSAASNGTRIEDLGPTAAGHAPVPSSPKAVN